MNLLATPVSAPAFHCGFCGTGCVRPVLERSGGHIRDVEVSAL